MWKSDTWKREKQGKRLKSWGKHQKYKQKSLGFPHFQQRQAQGLWITRGTGKAPAYGNLYWLGWYRKIILTRISAAYYNPEAYQ